MSPGARVAIDTLTRGTAQALGRGASHLLERQHPDGFWWGELTADSTLESDFILLELWLHPPVDGEWNPPSRARIERAVSSILARQLPDGGFAIYPGGPADVSASIKAYFSLKVAGVGMDEAPMRRLRERILELGGLPAANSYVKINLSLFNLYPRELCPSIPPEIMLLPGNFLYRMSSWTRAIVVPLSIVHASNPSRPVPRGFTLEEIVPPGASWDAPGAHSTNRWARMFMALDRLWKWWERRGLKSVRRRALREAERWMLERTKQSDGLAAIYPPMMYTIMALDVLGYGPDHPERVEAQRQFDALMVERGDALYFQPCFSVVWDTAIAAFALGEAGWSGGEALSKTADWLLSKEVRRKGDWSVQRPKTEPSGWYFEFANEFYPDIDDTGMVLLALRHAKSGDTVAQESSVARALRWLLDMQSQDGGWAAFDVDNNWGILSDVPFADHNAMLDPTCPDITGRVLEALCGSGVDGQHGAVRRGVDFLMRTQEEDGSWYGRWGVNYIYGTFLALRGLRAAGESDREAYILRAGEWLRSIQNADGGWGESCESYREGRYVAGPSMPSQTAWAVLGLLAGGDRTSLSVQKGIEYLVETQREDGGWDEDAATGTGFPRVFYLSYHLYRISFPVLAMGEFLKTRTENVRTLVDESR